MEMEIRLRERIEEDKIEKLSKVNLIKSQKELALNQRKKREIMFLGRIERCYHFEKQEKESKKKEYDEMIRRLEEEEQKMLDQLKQTQQMASQIQVRQFALKKQP